MKLGAMEKTDRFFFKIGANGIGGDIEEESKRLAKKDGGSDLITDSDMDDPNTDSEAEFRDAKKDGKDCSKNKLVFKNDENTLNKVVGMLAVFHTDIKTMPKGKAKKKLD